MSTERVNPVRLDAAVFSAAEEPRPGGPILGARAVISDNDAREPPATDRHLGRPNPGYELKPPLAGHSPRSREPTEAGRLLAAMNGMRDREAIFAVLNRQDGAGLLAIEEELNRLPRRGRGTLREMLTQKLGGRDEARALQILDDAHSPPHPRAVRARVQYVVNNGTDDSVRRDIGWHELQVATPAQKAALVGLLLEGATGNADEQAVLRISKSVGPDEGPDFIESLCVQGYLAQLCDDLHGHDYSELLALLPDLATDALSASLVIGRLIRDDNLGNRRAIDAILTRAQRAGYLQGIIDRMSDTLPEEVYARQLHAPGPAYGSPEFNSLLDSLTDSVERAGNETRLLFVGKTAFEVRTELMAGAQESIELQTFIFAADETGWATAELLAEKARANVRVRLLLDDMGCSFTPNEIFEFMEEAGIEIRRVPNPMTRVFERLRRDRLADGILALAEENSVVHEKHLIIDGRAVIEGGMNIADEYALGGTGRLVQILTKPEPELPWSDTDILIEGPVVDDMRARFFDSWRSVGGTLDSGERARRHVAPVVGETGVRFIKHDPHLDDNAINAYIATINSARRHIVLETPYFTPPKPIRDALAMALRRGVRVDILLNAKHVLDVPSLSIVFKKHHLAPLERVIRHTVPFASKILDTPIPVYQLSRYYATPLIELGANIVEKQESMVHSKTGSFDGEYCIVGSMNLNGRSDDHDTESIVTFRNADRARELEEHFQEALEHGLEMSAITREDSSRLIESLKARGIDWIADAL